MSTDEELITLELKADIKEIKEDGTFSGIASMYDVEDLQGDVIDKGAFKKTLGDKPDRVILWQHDTKLPIGRGVLKEVGNKITIEGKLEIDTMPQAMIAYNALKSRLVECLSIGFKTEKSRWEEVESRMVRHITELKLYEVSLVTFGALEQARITRVKSTDADRTEARVAQLETQIQTIKSDYDNLVAEQETAKAKLKDQLQEFYKETLTAVKATSVPEPVKVVEPQQQERIEPEDLHSELSTVSQLLSQFKENLPCLKTN